MGCGSSVAVQPSVTPPALPPSLPEGAAPKVLKSVAKEAKAAAKDATVYAVSLRSQATQKLSYLAKLELVVIDNSVRESTVGQVRGHTLADKHRFTELVRDTGIQHQLIATFSALQRRVDDQFCIELRDNPERYAGQVFYSFAEVAGQLQPAGAEPDLSPTVGLVRAHEYKLKNVFLEMDGVCKVLSTVAIATKVLAARISWIREHLGRGARIYVNLRDLPLVWDNSASTLRGVVRWLSMLPVEERITGIVFEDYTGNTLPALFSAFVAEVRATMTNHEWAGDLLVHVHNGYGLAEACVIGALGSGANGIWCGISREGAASGHANSLTTVSNLIKMGNTSARKRFDLAKMRAAAIEMTVICTGAEPHPSTELYGARALDIFFPGGGMGGDGDGDFNISELMRVPTKTRVSSLANPAMLSDALDEYFGPEPGGWPPAVIDAMFAAINRDLLSGAKIDYNSPEGLFGLLQRCGGPASERALTKLVELKRENEHPTLIAFRQLFEEHRFSGPVSTADFFDAFLGGCVSSPDSDVGREVLAVFDADGSGVINAAEAEWPLLWACRQFPKDCATLNDALQCIMRRIALPALERKLKLERLRSSLRKLVFARRLGGVSQRLAGKGV